MGYVEEHTQSLSKDTTYLPLHQFIKQFKSPCCINCLVLQAITTLDFLLSPSSISLSNIITEGKNFFICTFSNQEINLNFFFFFKSLVMLTDSAL